MAARLLPPAAGLHFFWPHAQWQDKFSRRSRRADSSSGNRAAFMDGGQPLARSIALVAGGRTVPAEALIGEWRRRQITRRHDAGNHHDGWFTCSIRSAPVVWCWKNGSQRQPHAVPGARFGSCRGLSAARRPRHAYSGAAPVWGRRLWPTRSGFTASATIISVEIPPCESLHDVVELAR